MAEAIDIASSVTTERTSLLRACRRIAELQHHLGSVPQAILLPIIVVASDLDNVPDEAQAALWEPEAFRSMLRERDAYLDQVDAELLSCFHELKTYLQSNA